ncbi:hypothetical protein [Psychrobacter sp. APC 3279]|uniref:hypothetical protein n=1 Tax=Psychrobacter sp. APC 3279 TaxID=3035189 RepID=UPI0025B51D71|nr:hypothetical protein [Psychrobacter sp. APC 3279]
MRPLVLETPTKQLSKHLQTYQPANFAEFVGNISLLMPLFDTMKNVVFLSYAEETVQLNLVN